LPDEYWSATHDTDATKEFLDWIVPEKGTFSAGFAGTAGAAVYLSGSVDVIALDSHGNATLFSPSVGGGGLLPVAGEGAFIFTWTDADNIEQLEGFSMVLGGSIEAGGLIGAERVFFEDTETRQKYSGVILTIGIGESPLLGEGHVGVNHTWAWNSFNLYNLFGIQSPD